MTYLTSILAYLLVVPSLCSLLQPFPQPPRRSALVCTVHGTADDVSVDVIGGSFAGTRWVESEDANDLLKKGDRLSLCALEAGALGEVTLTSDGCVESEQPVDAGAIWGLSFKGRIAIAPGKEEAYAKARTLREDIWEMDMVAVWSETDPRPTWVTAELLPGAKKEGSEYHRIAAEWLGSRGVADPEIDGMAIEQAVRADIDGDGVDEVFLAVRCAAHWAYTENGRSNDKFFNYLLMRHLRHGSRQVETVIVEDSAWRTLRVVGLCDLDGDGYAEVITRGQGLDYGGAQLFRWNGDRFQLIRGWGSGA